MEDNTHEMTIESLKLKVENQSKLIKELRNENEELYHQYNHLIIRNGKMLKRVDDFQKIIDDLHVRIEELQSTNGNILQINDQLRKRSDFSGSVRENNSFDRNRPNEESATEKIESGFDLDDLYLRWKSYPEQVAQNEPNLRKQVLMLVNLYNMSSLRAGELFNRCGVGGVTGARYVSTLKKFNLIKFSGARKKGHYEITNEGIQFIERSSTSNKDLNRFAKSAELKSEVTPERVLDIANINQVDTNDL